jgi:hypothetical protein
MLHASDPRYQYCKRVGKNVCVSRSEGQCRSQYGCTEPNCPLEGAFGLKAFDQRMQAFATVFGLWPLGGGKQPDFP